MQDQLGLRIDIGIIEEPSNGGLLNFEEGWGVLFHHTGW